MEKFRKTVLYFHFPVVDFLDPSLSSGQFFVMNTRIIMDTDRAIQQNLNYSVVIVPLNNNKINIMSVHVFQAQMFRKHWLTPPSPHNPESKRLQEIRLSDSEKGFERIGR